MSKTIKDARQVGLRKLLEQLGNRTHHEGTADSKPAGVSELDNLLDSIDFELTPPLRLDASNPVDLTISVGAAIVTNTENNRQKTIPHVGSLLPNDFASGTIVFPATSGNPITVTPGNDNTLTVPNNEYIKVLIYMDANGDLNVLPGTPNAIEADANVLPTPNNTLPIGYVTLFNNAGTIDNIAQDKIFQFGTGAGGGAGDGDASSFIEMVKNRLADSIFNAFTAYLARQDEDSSEIVDPTSTGTYDLITSRYKLDTGEIFLSQELFDDVFLAEATDLDKAELIVRYDSDGIDDAATYELSKDSGSTWETVTMERVSNTNTYRGVVDFPATGAGTPVTLQEFTDQALPPSELGSGSFERLAQDIEITAATVITQFNAEINVTGSPVGTITPKLVRADGTNFPSTNPSDVVWTGDPIDASLLATGTMSVTVNSPVLNPDVYHMTFTGDATYNAGVGGGNSISFRRDAGLVFSPGVGISYFDGVSWAAIVGSMTHQVLGYETGFGLRARITSSQDGTLIEGVAALFDQGVGDFAFDVDQAYVNSIIIEENRLGSTNPLYDRSVAGEGILLRATNGTLVEASIEETSPGNYQWVFAEVPE